MYVLVIKRNMLKFIPTGNANGRCKNLLFKFYLTIFYGGKSGLHRAGCRITSGRSNLRESATENIQPVFNFYNFKPAMVKW